MSKITANIINVYSLKSDDYFQFSEAVKLWDHNKKYNVPKARATALKLAKFLVKFQLDCEKTELTKTQIIELTEKSFKGFDCRFMRSKYKTYAEHYELIIKNAESVNSVSICPVNLVNMWNKAKAVKAKAKAEAEAKARARANPTEAKEAEALKQEAEEADKTVINRVQGAKHFERVVDPERQGQGTPVTPEEILSNVHRIHNAVIGMDNDDLWSKEQIAEIKRICLNTVNHLDMEKDEDDQVKTLTEDVKASFPVIARQIASM